MSRSRAVFARLEKALEKISRAGKTNQPLTILIDWELRTHPKVLELIEQGHQVDTIPNAPDLILSTKAWRWDEKYVDMALKASRKLKKEGV